MAAPSAVESARAVRWTRTPARSARRWTIQSERERPPSTHSASSVTAWSSPRPRRRPGGGCRRRPPARGRRGSCRGSARAGRRARPRPRSGCRSPAARERRRRRRPCRRCASSASSSAPGRERADPGEPVQRRAGGRDEALERVAGAPLAPPGARGEDAGRRARRASPACASTKAPVPSVTFAAPGPSSAARTATPAGRPAAARTGTPPRSGLASIRPSPRSAAAARAGTPNSSSSSSSQSAPPSGHSSERAGVAGVGDVDARQPVQQPGGHVAVGEAPVLGGGAGTVDVVEQPAQLRRREGRARRCAEPNASPGRSRRS